MKTKLVPFKIIKQKEDKKFKKTYVVVFVDSIDGSSFTVGFDKKPTSAQLNSALNDVDNGNEIVAILEVEH